MSQSPTSATPVGSAKRPAWRAHDGVGPDDAVGERASPVRTPGLCRRDAAPAQAKDGNVVPGHAERAALPERDLSELAEPVLHPLDAATRTDMIEPRLALSAPPASW